MISLKSGAQGLDQPGGKMQRIDHQAVLLDEVYDRSCAHSLKILQVLGYKVVSGGEKGPYLSNDGTRIVGPFLPELVGYLSWTIQLAGGSLILRPSQTPEDRNQNSESRVDLNVEGRYSPSKGKNEVHFEFRSLSISRNAASEDFTSPLSQSMSPEERAATLVKQLIKAMEPEGIWVEASATLIKDPLTYGRPVADENSPILEFRVMSLTVFDRRHQVERQYRVRFDRSDSFRLVEIYTIN